MNLTQSEVPGTVVRRGRSRSVFRPAPERTVMQKNACGRDRMARLIGGTLLAAVALGTSGGLYDRDDELSTWQILAMYAAGELLVTGLLQWCPCNYVLGIDTCSGDRSWWRSFARSIRRLSSRPTRI